MLPLFNTIIVYTASKLMQIKYANQTTTTITNHILTKLIITLKKKKKLKIINVTKRTKDITIVRL